MATKVVDKFERVKQAVKAAMGKLNLSADFMQPQVFKAKGLEVETKSGTWFLPEVTEDDASLKDMVEGEILEVKPIEGWFGRYSAPGYLDATDFVFDETEEGVKKELEYLYGNDDEEEGEGDVEASVKADAASGTLPSTGNAPQETEMKKKALVNTDVRPVAPKEFTKSKPKALPIDIARSAPAPENIQQLFDSVSADEAAIAKIKSAMETAAKAFQKRLTPKEEAKAQKLTSIFTALQDYEMNVVKVLEEGKEMGLAADSERKIATVNLPETAQKDIAKWTAAKAKLMDAMKKMDENIAAIKDEAFKKHGGTEIETNKVRKFPLKSSLGSDIDALYDQVMDFIKGEGADYLESLSELFTGLGEEELAMAASKKLTAARAFDVFLNDEEIDTVFYSDKDTVTEDEVKRALIDHDGYDQNIEVREHKKKKIKADGPIPGMPEGGAEAPKKDKEEKPKEEKKDEPKKEGKSKAGEIEILKDGKVIDTFPDAFGDDSVAVIKFFRKLYNITEGDDKEAVKEEKGEDKPKAPKKEKKDETPLEEKPLALPKVEEKKEEKPVAASIKAEDQAELDKAKAFFENRIKVAREVVAALVEKNHVVADQSVIDQNLMQGMTLEASIDGALKVSADRKFKELLATSDVELLTLRASLPNLKPRIAAVDIQASKQTNGELSLMELSILASATVGAKTQDTAIPLSAAFGSGIF